MTSSFDDETISGSEWLYRRVPPRQTIEDSNRKRRTPSSASMMPASGDVDVSCYIGSLLSAAGLGPSAVIENHPGYWVVRFTAAAARSAGYGIVLEPEKDSTRPLACDPAHALLTGTPTGSKTKKVPARALVGDPVFEVVIVGDDPPDDAEVGP